MKHKQYLLLGFLFLIVLIVVFFVLFQMRPHSQKTIEAEIKISDYIGIKLDTDKLYFGTAYPSGKAERSVNISTPKDSYVIITTGGQLGNWIRPNENGFLLEGGEVKDIFFTVFVPEDAEFGNYTGTVTFTFYKPFMNRLV